MQHESVLHLIQSGADSYANASKCPYLIQRYIDQGYRLGLVMGWQASLGTAEVQQAPSQPGIYMVRYNNDEAKQEDFPRLSARA